MFVENSFVQCEFLCIERARSVGMTLIEIKNMLAKYFAEAASREMDKLWDENGWSNDTMDKWSKEHMRTKYN